MTTLRPAPTLRNSLKKKPARSYIRFLRAVVGHLTLGTVVVILIPFLCFLAYLRFFGLPENIKQELLAEVDQRHLLPYPLSVDRLLLDPTGAILAEKVVVYRDPSRQRILLQVDRVRISIAWFSWWRGRGFIDGASVSNAEVRLPVGPQNTADFHEVNADFYFDGHDVKIENAQARILCFSISLRGTIHNDGFPPSKTAATPDELGKRGKIWQQVLDLADEVATESPLEAQLNFETSTSDLAGGRADFDFESHRITWHTATISELSLHATLQDRSVTLDDFRLGGERGEFNASGAWNLVDRTAQLQFNSTLDFTTLAPAFTGATRSWMERLDFPLESPAVAGRVNMDLTNGFSADVQTDIDWRNFRFNGTTFQRLTIPLACDSKRFLIPGMTMESDAGKVDAKAFFDFTKTPPHLVADVDSTLDPTVLKGVFGEGFDKFLASCEFSPGVGPTLHAKAESSAMDANSWVIHGKMGAAEFKYKGTSFASAGTDFTYQNKTLDMPNLVVVRSEGDATGSVFYDFGNHTVRMKNMVTTVNVAEVAPVLGPKFVEYTAPYHFASPPHIIANGLVDLQSGKVDLDTDLTIDLQGRSSMEWILFHIPFVYEEPIGTLYFKNRRLDIAMKHAGYDGGVMSGELDMNLRNVPATYDLNMNLSHVDFQKFMVQVFGYKQSTGRMELQTKLSGTIGEMQTLVGDGDVSITNGKITEIPFLGALTPQLPDLSTANSARGHYRAGNSLITTTDLTISSAGFSLLGEGNYNYMVDDLDMDMRVNGNNLFGLLLYPVSKIFEYHGTGPLKNTKWTPKNF